MAWTLAVVLLVLSLPGCYYYGGLKGLSPQEYITAQHPKWVRVTLVDGSRHTLMRPWVANDSIGGQLAIGPEGGSFRRGRTWAVALAELQELKARKFDSMGTVALSAITLGVIGLVAATQIEAGF